MKPRFVHSFWTSPAMLTANGDRTKAVYDMWVFAMSAWHIRNNGYEIVLHTDAYGEQVFGDIPYNNIYRTLDKIDVDTAFWAASKMVAQAAEPLGSIHVDGDVFIKKPDILKKLTTLDYDLLIEKKTNLGCNPWIMEKMKPHIWDTLPEWFNTETTEVYNTGVTAFNNQALKDEFLQKFWEWSSLLTRAEDYMKHPTQSDLIIEMGWLRQLAEQMQVDVKEIFQYGEDSDWDTADARIWSDNEGYEHNYKTSKYRLLPNIKAFLQKHEPGLFEKLWAKFIPTLF